jgi:hypothetical protein
VVNEKGAPKGGPIKGTKERNEGSKGRNEGPNGRNEGPNGRNEGPNGRNEGPNGRNEGPNGRNEGPNGRNEGSKERNEGSKGRNEGPNGRNEGPTGRNEGPKGNTKVDENRERNIVVPPPLPPGLRRPTISDAGVPAVPFVLLFCSRFTLSFSLSLPSFRFSGGNSGFERALDLTLQNTL